MNKILLTLLALGAMAGVAHADTALDASPYSFVIPISKNGVQDSQRKWTPPSLVRVEDTATATHTFTGKGILVGVCVTSGTAGDYAMAFDSSSVGGLTNNEAGYTLARQVTNPFASPTVGQDTGCTNFPDGVPFTSGLVIKNSSAVIRSYWRYRKLRQ